MLQSALFAAVCLQRLGDRVEMLQVPHPHTHTHTHTHTRTHTTASEILQIKIVKVSSLPDVPYETTTKLTFETI